MTIAFRDNRHQYTKVLCDMQLFKCCAVLSFANLVARLLRLKLTVNLPQRISEATKHSYWLRHCGELFMRN